MGISKRTEKQAQEHYEREDKKHALMSYIRKKAEERRAEEKLTQFMISRSAVKGVAYDRKGAGTGSSEPMMQEDFMIEKEELMKSIRTARSETDKAKKGIMEWIDTAGELLHMRYISGMDITFIAIEYGWTRRHTERMLDKAIDALPEIPEALA